MPTENAKNNSTRGELKLLGAVEAFGFDFRGKTVLDIGSSTGGFTEVTLKKGAEKVIAVEKGTNQMKAPLRYDPRIELHEKTDIFDVTLKCLNDFSRGRSGALAQVLPSSKNVQAFQPNHKRPSKDCLLKSPIDVVLADVSFVSLRPILLKAKELTGKKAEFLVMLKPQFEAKPEQLVKGVVKNEKIRREIIKDFEKWLIENNFVILNKRDNQLAGKNGNKERFYLLKLAQKT